MSATSIAIRSTLLSTTKRDLGRSPQHFRSYGVRRYASTHSPPITPNPVFRLGRGSKLTLLAGGTLAAYGVLATPEDEESLKQSRPSLSALVRTYIVYTFCSFPTLVDASPAILKTFMGVPVVKQVTEKVVRLTFFDHFIGGDTAAETIPVLRVLRAQNKGALFAYSVEVDEDEASGAGSSQSVKPHKRIVQEMLRCIDVAAEFEDTYPGANGRSEGGARKTWVALKLTALLPDAHALINLSKHILASRSGPAIPFPGNPESSDLDILSVRGPSSKYITEEDIAALKELRGDLERVCSRAQQKGVKIILDAEYSWYQPAIDAYTLHLYQKFNRLPTNSDAKTVQPLIYGTYQAYLRRTPEHLEKALEHAKARGYSLGVKLVRGAYHPHETTAHSAPPSSGSLSISPDPHPPVWSTKEDTDKCYNECVKVLIKAVKDDVVASSSPRTFTSSLPLPSLPSSWWPTSLRGRSPEQVPDANVAQHSPIKASAPRVGLLFGTHNWTSCRTILNELVQNGLAREEKDVHSPTSITKEMAKTVVSIPNPVVERVAVGQLYGMSDDLTDWLVNSTKSSSPLIIKYVPYGALSEVMPYLGRRAIENKSVLGDGAAVRERRRAGREIRRRLFGSWTPISDDDST